MVTTQEEEIVKAYCDESREHLADIETDLLAIEKAGADIDEHMVNKVFRSVHSIKGGAGFLALNQIKELAHKLESVLGKIRSREMVPTPDIVNVLLLAFDKLKGMVYDIDSSESASIAEHLEGLAQLMEPKAGKPEKAEIVPEPMPATPVKPETGPLSTSGDARTGPATAETLVNTAPSEERSSETSPVKPESKPKSVKAEASETVQSDTSLRVHVSLLDTLMTLAGEMVLSRNQLLQAMS
ncbi:MAG: Hpt domain-containing protein, partial [Pseudomonadota bacterium]